MSTSLESLVMVFHLQRLNSTKQSPWVHFHLRRDFELPIPRPCLEWCLSDYDPWQSAQTPETIDLAGRNSCLGFWFERFQSMVTCLYCFWTWRRKKVLWGQVLTSPGQGSRRRHIARMGAPETLSTVFHDLVFFLQSPLPEDSTHRAVDWGPSL